MCAHISVPASDVIDAIFIIVTLLLRKLHQVLRQSSQSTTTHFRSVSLSVNRILVPAERFRQQTNLQQFRLSRSIQMQCVHVLVLETFYCFCVAHFSMHHCLHAPTFFNFISIQMLGLSLLFIRLYCCHLFRIPFAFFASYPYYCSVSFAHFFVTVMQYVNVLTPWSANNRGAALEMMSSNDLSWIQYFKTLHIWYSVSGYSYFSVSLSVCLLVICFSKKNYSDTIYSELNKQLLLQAIYQAMTTNRK